ncbi:2-keto-4-pentenoate hydratase [Nocardioides sp. BE266]|uniref:2-keto-4-pentenoate hydratase n=1 Tax=Nocardioides sp. BE266 TaxID=2817725 RepID=UPI0028607DCB|nr:fumarylacetoacetate hydrolase family protein [Nocardioides sp. BE266]MDR7254220.1 2-keto-4-pentenoate hydratase [Nocardioides sp. BE266]
MPSTDTTVPTQARQAARRLLDAAAADQPCPPVRDLIGVDDTGLAYSVQQLVNAERVARGSRAVGRKIGLTSPAVQQQLGVDQPDFGVLFDDMAFADGDTVPFGRLLQPKVEGEIAFVLVDDLAEGSLELPQVRAAVAYAVPAVEIVDSRVQGWDITFADTVSDNASSGLYVLGESRASLEAFEPAEAEMTLEVDGSEVSSGNGRACLGDPLLALQWLARTARDLGDPLLAGQVVLSGALGPMVAVSAGSAVRVRIRGLGEVAFTFSGESE